MSDLFPVNVVDALLELRREQKVRRGVYPGWVQRGKLNPDIAELRMCRLAKAIEILEAQAEVLGYE